MAKTYFPNRRGFLQTAGLTASLFAAKGLFAEQLAMTASTTEGPFYPDKLPLDTDNDLLLLNDAITPAVGEITHLTGRILSNSGEPVRNAFIEIWQVDNTGSYVHTQGRQATGNDRNFQGYGRFLTDAKGQYYFRTIKPVEYTLQGSFRTAHIHVAISKGGRRIFTTQLFVDGYPANTRDSLIQRMDAPSLKTLLTDFSKIPESKLGELKANFDIVLGKTAADPEDTAPRGTGAPSSRRGSFTGR